MHWLSHSDFVEEESVTLRCGETNQYARVTCMVEMMEQRERTLHLQEQGWKESLSFYELNDRTLAACFRSNTSIPL
jgi:hypothetical protein